MSYIKFENLYKSFGSNDVLTDINLEIEQGQLVTLLGPSGCGKSTLLRCLAGLETVTSGKVYLDGKDITNVDPKNRGIGMVFQQYSLFPNMTTLQNVKFGLNMKRSTKNWPIRNPGRSWRSSAWAISSATILPSCPAGSSSAPPWPGRSSRSRRSCFWTNRFLRSTLSCGILCRWRSAGSSAIWASPPSSSHTTRKKPWSCRI